MGTQVSRTYLAFAHLHISKNKAILSETYKLSSCIIAFVNERKRIHRISSNTYNVIPPVKQVYAFLVALEPYVDYSTIFSAIFSCDVLSSTQISLTLLRGRCIKYNVLIGHHATLIFKDNDLHV